MRGPHGAPDFLTPDGLERPPDARRGPSTTTPTAPACGSPGRRPEWARADGGEAGLHPSNILDSAYGVGTVMLAGDMAVVVGPDGPSLGGFAAIAQVVRDDLWKLGQVRAGDEVTLEPVDRQGRWTLHRGRQLARTNHAASPDSDDDPRRPRDGSGGPLTFRRAGERGLLVEFGEPVLDLRSRVRAHLLREALDDERLDGIVDLTPGVRSLHVHHDPDRLPDRQAPQRARRASSASSPTRSRTDGPRPRRPPPARLARIARR